MSKKETESELNTVVQEIINHHTGMAVAAAIVPVPVADAALIIGVQVSMIGRIALHYDKLFDRKTISSFVYNSVASSTGVFLASLIKFIPFIGSIGGGILQMSIAGSITYMLGLTIDELYSKGLPITKKNFDKHKGKHEEKAKQKAKDISKKVEEQQKINEEINFRCTQEHFKSQVTFKYNGNGYNAQKIEIREAVKGDIVKTYKIKKGDESFTWKPSAKDKAGYYISYLFIPDLLPISCKVKYE